MRMRLLALAVCAGALVGATPATAAAADCSGLPKHSDLPVVDAANVIEPQAEAYLVADLLRFHIEGNEAIVAATVPTTGGDDIASYAQRLFDCWGIGDAESDNGVLILLALRERKVRIEVGAGLEDRLGEVELELALNEMVAPLRAGDIGAGLRAGAVSIADDLGGQLPDTRAGIGGTPGTPIVIPSRNPGDVSDEPDGSGVPAYSVDDFPGGSSPFASDDSPGIGAFGLVPVLVILGVVGVITRAVFRGGISFGGGGSAWRGGFGQGMHSGWGPPAMYRGGGWHTASGWSGGGSSPSSSSFGSSSSSGSSSGSSSSFGGGSSGGGGASGSW